MIPIVYEMKPTKIIIIGKTTYKGHIIRIIMQEITETKKGIGKKTNYNYCLVI